MFYRLRNFYVLLHLKHVWVKLCKTKMKTISEFHLIATWWSIEPPNAIFVTQSKSKTKFLETFDGVHFNFRFLLSPFKMFGAITDMIIARLLSPEKCDTVFNFTSLTINGLSVAHLLPANPRLQLFYKTLRLTFFFLFSTRCFFGNFLRKIWYNKRQKKQPNSIGEFCEWIPNTLAAREILSKMRQKLFHAC